jgi:hypothetical protein
MRKHACNITRSAKRRIAPLRHGASSSSTSSPKRAERVPLALRVYGNGEQALSDIFLSYKHAQCRQARQLAAALAAHGWTAWWDWNIPAGARWEAELDAQLDAAGCVVVLWSAESLQSDWVIYEAQFGLRKDKLIQVLLELSRKTHTKDAM